MYGNSRFKRRPLQFLIPVFNSTVIPDSSDCGLHVDVGRKQDKLRDSLQDVSSLIVQPTKRWAQGCKYFPANLYGLRLHS